MKQSSHGNENTNKSSKFSLVLILLAVVSLVALLVCIAMLVKYSLSSYRANEKLKQLEEMLDSSDTGTAVQENITVSPADSFLRDDGILKKYADLYDRNPDFAGWIYIDGTRIDYPVMQTIQDEEYYLHRDFDKQDSDEGLPFLDLRCRTDAPSTNLLIYGHNMKNGDMFADLLKYDSREYYQGHRIIRFDTLYEEALYEIVAVFRTRVAYRDENTFRFYNFIEADTSEDFEYYIENIRALSLYDTGTEVSEADTLLTLSTCEYTVDDGRFVVVAKKLKDMREN